MIKRRLESQIIEALERSPSVALLGPRQVDQMPGFANIGFLSTINFSNLALNILNVAACLWGSKIKLIKCLILHSIYALRKSTRRR
jgi:hypothetical protein